MVKEYLEPHADVLSMDYNPWFYGDSTEAITRDIITAQEDYIRRDPANWFWVHNRWKPHPKAEAR